MTRKALCCKKFVLPASYKTLKTLYLDWYLQRKTKRKNVKDIHLIFPMVVPLGKGDKYKGKGKTTQYYYYTCKHLVNDRCSIHAIRPHVCRIFSLKDCKSKNNKYEKCTSNCFGVKND